MIKPKEYIETMNEVLVKVEAALKDSPNRKEILKYFQGMMLEAIELFTVMYVLSITDDHEKIEKLMSASYFLAEENLKRKNMN